MAQLQSDFASTNFYDNSYYGGHYGLVSDFNLVQDYTLKYFSGFVDGVKTAAATPQLLTTIPGGLNPDSFPPGYFPPALQEVIVQYPGDSIAQYVNGQNAWLYGFELIYQQRLSYLPGLLHGLEISANYSYTKSREKGVPPPHRSSHTHRPVTPQLQHQPYLRHQTPFDARGTRLQRTQPFSYSWISPSLVKGADPSGLGPFGPSGDVFTLPHLQVDAQASYRVFRGWSAVVSGLNLNNEVFGYYTGSTQFVNQREYYKPTISGGIRYNFQSGR